MANCVECGKGYRRRGAKHLTCSDRCRKRRERSRVAGLDEFNDVAMRNKFLLAPVVAA